MLLTKHDPLVHSGTITLNRILKVNDFIVNSLGSGAKIGIVLDVNQVMWGIGLESHGIYARKSIMEEVIDQKMLVGRYQILQFCLSSTEKGNTSRVSVFNLNKCILI